MWRCVIQLGLTLLLLAPLGAEDRFQGLPTVIQPSANVEPLRLSADETGEASEATGLTPVESPGTDPLLRAMLILVILAGGAAAFWWWKRRGPSSGLPGMKRDSHLQIVETRMLGNRQFLIVADYEGRRMLLGVGPGLINHLCDLGQEAPFADQIAATEASR